MVKFLGTWEKIFLRFSIIGCLWVSPLRIFWRNVVNGSYAFGRY